MPRRAPAVQTFGSAALPSRAAVAPVLEARAARVALGLRRSLGGAAAPEGDRSALAADASATLARGRELHASGALDEAALVLDQGLEATARAPHRFAASEVVVASHLDRATIALARGEDARAELLLERLLRWDPTFALAPGEGTPRLVQAVADVRRRLGRTPELRAADLGAACTLGDVVVVARPAAAARIELQRFDGCRRVASATVRPADVDPAVELLGGRADAFRFTAEPTSAASPRLIARPWFWVAVGAVAVTAGLVVWQVSADPSDQADVTPHL
ncbi:MAG TPA: hypothetical protein VMZ28_19245 [Kofleriaceae bacterium]|nr:hypothetical protein [Kofleriaceae bacterium]